RRPRTQAAAFGRRGSGSSLWGSSEGKIHRLICGVFLKEAVAFVAALPAFKEATFYRRRWKRERGGRPSRRPRWLGVARRSAPAAGKRNDFKLKDFRFQRQPWFIHTFPA